MVEQLFRDDHRDAEGVWADGCDRDGIRGEGDRLLKKLAIVIDPATKTHGAFSTVHNRLGMGCDR